MDNSRLRKFARESRTSLLAQNNEEISYFGFMRLCAMAYAERSALSEIMSKPEKLRSALFCEKCRQLADKFGGIFRLADELPVPPNIFSDGGTAAELLGLSDDFRAYPDILGRFHQYYNEPYRDEISVGLKSSKRLSSDKIAAATQIFTPEWVVKYMVRNTLCSCLREMRYKIKSNEYDFDIRMIRKQQSEPESITLIDPCMGSGNILLYAFDVFMELYTGCGISPSDAAEKILRFNLFGLELDDRACALAETALRVKAAEYGVYSQPQVYDFSGIDSAAGSLLKGEHITSDSEKSGKIKELLSRRYTAVVTNPPYLGRPAMNTELSAFVSENYGEYGADLFSAFIPRCMEMAENGGYLGFLTPATWLFLQSYEQLRRKIYADCSLRTLIHFEYSAFDDATVPLCAFTMKMNSESKKGTYLRLTEFRGGMEIQRQKVIEAISSESCPYRFEADTSDFLSLPSAPLAYFLSRSVLRAFSGTPLGDVCPVKEGLITGDNDRFLRLWHEVSSEKTAFSFSPEKKWFLINKGGRYRRWYGNREYVVNWENDGREIKNFRDRDGRLRSRPQGLAYNFRPSVSWSQITSGAFSVRYFDENFMFNVAGTSAFPDDGRQLLRLLGLLNSKAAAVLSSVLNPTLNMNPGDAARLPLPEFPQDCTEAEELVRENIALCREDWDSFETSFDFRRHPLI